MGVNGYNAGGFAYMERVVCPRCGVIRPLGRHAIACRDIACSDRRKCDKRKADGRYLHRLTEQPIAPGEAE